MEQRLRENFFCVAKYPGPLLQRSPLKRTKNFADSRKKVNRKKNAIFNHNGMESTVKAVKWLTLKRRNVTNLKNKF